jgi:hypothetical protein
MERYISYTYQLFLSENWLGMNLIIERKNQPEMNSNILHQWYPLTIDYNTIS